MLTWFRKLALATALGAAVLALPSLSSVAQDKKAEKKGDEKTSDEKKADEKKAGPPAKLPDFAKEFAAAGEVAGVVVEADDESVTVRMTYAVPYGKGKAKQESKDFTFPYAPGGLARTKVTPTKENAKGKPVKLNSGELEPLRKPQGAPGYHLERADLQPGHVVTLTLLRPKSTPASKATAEDKVVKFATVVGEAAIPAAPPAMPDKAKEKPKAKDKK